MWRWISLHCLPRRQEVLSMHTYRRRLSRYIANSLVRELHPNEDPKCFRWVGPIVGIQKKSFNSWITKVFLPEFNSNLDMQYGPFKFKVEDQGTT